MGYFRRQPLIAACAALAVLLLVVLGFETGWGTGLRPPLPPPSSRPAITVDARVLPPLALGTPDQAYPDTVNRPLFIPTRRPVPAAPSAGSGAMAKGSLTLQGVIVANGVRTAILREKASGRLHRVQQGREVNGMTIAQIEPDRVLLRQGEDQEMVVMSVQKAPGNPGSAAASGPFPGASPAGAAVNPAHIGNPAMGTVSQPPAGFGGMPTPAPHPDNPGMPAGPPPNPPAQVAPNAAAQPNAAPMTPEELLARRRARRNQQ
jgi:hypothetical protein